MSWTRNVEVLEILAAHIADHFLVGQRQKRKRYRRLFGDACRLAVMKTSDKRATAELLIATIEAAIARGCKHYSTDEAFVLFPPALTDTGEWIEGEPKTAVRAEHTFEEKLAALGDIKVIVR